jgi:hypothetical protein
MFPLEDDLTSSMLSLVFLFFTLPRLQHPGKKFPFPFETSSPRATLGEEIYFFKTSSSSADAQALGKPVCFFKNSLPRVPNAQALGEAPFGFSFYIFFPECHLPGTRGSPLLFFFLYFLPGVPLARHSGKPNSFFFFCFTV